MQKCTIGEFIATTALFAPFVLMIIWGILR